MTGRNLRNILLPISALYGGVVSLRNRGYDAGVFSSRSLPRPVVSVGNISVGGSGKTPFVMYLLEKFRAMGKKPAVLSRGYKRLTSKLVISCPAQGREADIQMLGDEPALISANFPEVPVAVLADRHRSGLEVLKNFDTDVFVLDDGFQNRELNRDLDFVLMNRSLYDLQDSYLPAGNLRDSKRRLKQADVLVMTAHGSSRAERDYSELLGRFSPAPVAGVNYNASDLYDHAGKRYPLGYARNKRIVAFCGIAHHEQFFGNVAALGGHVAAEKRFPDHHWYDRYNIDEIFDGDEECIAVTTAKDAVRIFEDEELLSLDEIGRIYALAERAVVEFGEEHIDAALKGVFERVYA